jgi:hypothetical protein
LSRIIGENAVVTAIDEKIRADVTFILILGNVCEEEEN